MAGADVFDHDDGAQAVRTGQVLASVREFLGGPTRAGERFGNMQRVFSQNPMRRFSTPHSSILARSLA